MSSFLVGEGDKLPCEVAGQCSEIETAMLQCRRPICDERNQAVKPEIIDDATWEEWPRCPQCDLRRQVTCPTCLVEGRDFPLAELIAQSPDLVQIKGTEQRENWEILLMCTECDEAFPPSYYRRCEQCGHQFPDGQIVLDEEEPQEQLPTRVLAVILAFIILAIIAYFYLGTLV